MNSKMRESSLFFCTTHKIVPRKSVSDEGNLSSRKLIRQHLAVEIDKKEHFC